MDKQDRHELTIRYAQQQQPWTVPYSPGVESAARSRMVPHILASHCVLHAVKSVGKLSAVFEALDHYNNGQIKQEALTPEQLTTVRAMSADLVTAALRFANLYDFDLSDELEARVREKNGVGYGGDR